MMNATRAMLAEGVSDLIDYNLKISSVPSLWQFQYGTVLHTTLPLHRSWFKRTEHTLYISLAIEVWDVDCESLENIFDVTGGITVSLKKGRDWKEKQNDFHIDDVARITGASNMDLLEKNRSWPWFYVYKKPLFIKLHVG